MEFTHRYANEEETRLVLLVDSPQFKAGVEISANHSLAPAVEFIEAYSVPPLGVDDAYTDISMIYESAMTRLSGKYTQKEIDTFHRKSVAAGAYAIGTATDDHTYYLAKIDGVVNGSAPLSPAEKSAEVAAIDAAGLAKVAERVQKILEAESAFDFYSAKIEQVRNAHIDQLVDGADNQSVVDSLTDIYGAML